jgi:hypothetical protein
MAQTAVERRRDVGDTISYPARTWQTRIQTYLSAGLVAFRNQLFMVATSKHGGTAALTAVPV